MARPYRAAASSSRVPKHLPPELRQLVHDCVAILGEVIRSELGEKAFMRIEGTRRQMRKLRETTTAGAVRALRRELRKLEALSPPERRDFARAYTLMLELMNACENAYRAHRIRSRNLPLPEERPQAIIYVLTAHPTEARSPESIWVFHQILPLLARLLERGLAEPHLRSQLRHWIGLAWKLPVVRERKPRVEDEAVHIYSTLLRDEILAAILAAGQELAPVFVRSWVGGDKDGHPAVNERVFLTSLTLSRRELLRFAERRVREAQDSARILGAGSLLLLCHRALAETHPLRTVLPGDAVRLVRFRKTLRELTGAYSRELGALHPALSELRQLFRVFPALVVPLEFRESSDMLEAPPISRMLGMLAEVSRRCDPRWYVRGFIISMAESFEHVRTAARLVRERLGELTIPVIPLFEQEKALRDSPEIVRQMLKDRELRTALKKYWGGYLEVMVGYSDSSKQSGVLPSRLRIAEAMHAIDERCRDERVTPLFFQGSGGSVDRGGGSVAEQTAWWPAGALKNYKVTIQGEMVERSLANPEITRGQLERITQSAGRWPEAATQAMPGSEALESFANRVASRYRSMIHSPELLEAVELATPYSDLDVLRIGSRPTKRAGKLSVEGLRAIPWVLCWTQTRVLFPIWWGVGSAWAESNGKERRELIRVYADDPLFSSFMRALGFTLAKVELPVWRMYLERSPLPRPTREKLWEEFISEYERALTFTCAVTRTELLSWQPWLRESITLRSPMIHPLNLLQILAIEQRDSELLRLTVTGIASGMMTTG